MTFNFKVEPFHHQRVHFEEHKDTEYWGLFWQQGSAKTKPIIDTAAYLWLEGKIELLIVIALKGVHTNWTRREIPKHMTDDVPVQMHAWSPRSPVPKYLQEGRDAFVKADPKEGLKVLAVNVEGFSGYKQARNNPLMKFLAKIIKAHEGKVMGVVDESSSIKDPKSTRTKRVLKFTPYFAYRRALTGTPITESPFNVWAQAEFLKPGILGDYEKFKYHHGKFKKVHFGHGATKRSFFKLESYAYLPELRRKLSQFSSEVKKSDCFDLPDKLFEVKEVELSLEQIRAYDQMRELFLHEMETSEGDKEIITATNALHRLRRLHDITLGFARDDPDTEQERVTHRFKHNRLRALDEIIEESQGKMLIFADAVPAIEELIEHLRKEHGEKAVVSYYGKTNDEDRETAIDEFQNPESDVRFLIGGSMSSIVYGQTLTAAETVVFYANAYSLERRLQAEDRVHRAGLKHPVTYFDLVSPGTVDEKVISDLLNKIDVGSQVVNLLEGYLKNKPLTPS